MEAPQERFALLRARLQDLRYHQPLGLESAPLVEALLGDLLRSHEQLAELRKKADAQAQELIVAQAQVHPLRKENGRLVRESNRLQFEQIEAAERAAERDRERENASSALVKENGDLRFVGAQQAQRVKALEVELQGLRDRFDDALQVSGVVLPNGHEVRWHGRKEHMEQHSPVAPAAAEDLSPRAAAAADAAAAEAVRASTVQIDALQARLDASNDELAAANLSLSVEKEKVAAREAEIERLGRELESDRDYGGLSLKHIQESNQQAVAQLNHQVDFLNAQCAELQAEVEATRGSYALAEQRQAEKEELLYIVDVLNNEKEGVRSELQAVQESLSQLQQKHQLVNVAAPGIERRWRAACGAGEPSDHKTSTIAYETQKKSRETRACAERFLASEKSNRMAAHDSARRLASASTERILESSRLASAVSTRAGMRGGVRPRPASNVVLG